MMRKTFIIGGMIQPTEESFLIIKVMHQNNFYQKWHWHKLISVTEIQIDTMSLE